jgi:hypothetical protein
LKKIKEKKRQLQQVKEVEEKEKEILTDRLFKKSGIERFKSVVKKVIENKGNTGLRNDNIADDKYNDEKAFYSGEDENSSLDSISSIETNGRINDSKKSLTQNNSLSSLKIPLLDLSKTYYEEEKRRFSSLRQSELEKTKNKGKNFFRQSKNKGIDESYDNSSLLSSKNTSRKRPNMVDLGYTNISNTRKEKNAIDTFYTLLNPSPPIPMLSSRQYMF